ALRQRIKNVAFQVTAIIGLLLAVCVLLMLLLNVLRDGLSRMDWSFMTSYPSRRAENAGIVAGLAGSFYMVVLTGIVAIPIGIGTAIYLEEYGRKNWIGRV